MSFSKQLPISIIKRAQRGDQFALVQIYHEYKVAIYSLAHRITQDRDASEDIVQQVVEKVLLKIKYLNNRKGFNGWLKRIAYNQTIDYIKKKDKEISIEDMQLDFTESVNLTKSLSETAYDVKKFLTLLNKTERLVVVMFSLEGYSHKDIARALSISESSSKQIYRRSLMKLEKLSQKESYSGKKLTKVYSE